MHRARFVCAVIAASTVCAAARAAAQSPADGWVLLPVDEYRALRERALPTAPPLPAPPVDATVTRVDYDLRVDADAATGHAVLTIDVLRDGWTRVPIPTGLRARDARLDGQPISLIDGPPAHLLVSRAGRFLLTLDIALPIAASAGTESVVLPASSSPIARAALALSKNGVDLTAAGGFVAEHAESGGESRWIAFGRPNQSLTLSWKRRVDDHRAEQPVRVRARLTTLVGLSEETCADSTAVRAEVVQGVAREIALALPSGFVVNSVDGSTVGDWESSGGMLRVRPLDPVADEMSFVVQGETRAPREGAIVVPLLRMPSAERETGGIAIDVIGAGELSGRQARGVDPTDPTDLGDIVAGKESPSMLAFRLTPAAGTAPRGLAVTVVRYTPQAVLIANVEEARYRALASEDGRLLVHARYAVRNNQRSFLKVSLPQASTVWSAEVAGRPVRPGVAQVDAVLLPLEKGRAGVAAPTFVVDLVYFQRIAPWAGKGRARIDLPALDLPVSRTGLELFYSPRLHVDLEPGAFRTEPDPGVFAEALRVPLPGIDVRSGDARDAGGLQTLVDRYRNEPGSRTVVASLPVHVTFPAFGPSIFLASELTEEGRTPFVEVIYTRARS